MNTVSLSAFVSSVKSAIVRVNRDGRFGDRKVFVYEIWRATGAGRCRLGLDDFKAQLFRAFRAGLLSLARADLVAAMSPERVAASEIAHDGVTFHFVIDDGALDPWDRGGMTGESRGPAPASAWR